MNIFRILADLSHIVSKCILIWAIHSNKSAEGVSLLTQLLYILVFGSRYLDIFVEPPSDNWWNFIIKIFYLSSSSYIVFIMMRLFARTREKEYGWKLALWSLGGCLTSAPLVALLYFGWKKMTIIQVFWTFSIQLEAFCVLPQLLLLRQTSVPTVIDSFYLVTLGSYRFFYILNWITIGIMGQQTMYTPLSAIFGVIQTAFYIDFAWVYWTRQRVKLRGGGVIDSDDLSKSFLVRRFISGRQSSHDDRENDDMSDDVAALARQEDGIISPQPRRAHNWGTRGISVSADDTLLEHDVRQDAQMVDPTHFEDNDDEADEPPALATASSRATKKVSIEKSSKTSTVTEGTASATIESSAGEWQGNDGAGHQLFRD